MTTGPYKPLLGIEVEHGFFADGRCRGLEFVPTPHARRVMDKSGLLTRHLENGVQVFYDRGDTESLARHVSDEGGLLGLSFKVFCRDPFFSNYTEPGLPGEESVLYFDSQKAESEESGRHRLSIAETAGEADFESWDAPALAEVLDRRDRLVKPAFVVTLHLSESGVAPQGESREIAPASYYVRFNNRQTFWKYYLLGDLAREGLHIADLDNQVEFEPLGRVSWADGRSALSYRSQTPLPLQERSPYRFQLREDTGAGGKVLVRRLPVAAACQIGRDTLNEEPVPLSEIFVNC